MSRIRNRSKKKYINNKPPDRVNKKNHKQASLTQSEIILYDRNEDVEEYVNNIEAHTIGEIPCNLSSSNEQLNYTIDIELGKESCQPEDEYCFQKDDTENISYDSSLADISFNSCLKSFNFQLQDNNDINLSLSNSQINIVKLPKTEKFSKLLDFFESNKNVTKSKINNQNKIDDAVIIPEKITSKYKQEYIKSIRGNPEPSKNILERLEERTFEFKGLLNKWKERSNLTK